MSGITTLIIIAAVMACTLGGVSLLAYVYNLNHIKSKTVGDGQHGTARWATKTEIHKTYAHVPYTPNKWREQAKNGNNPTMSVMKRKRKTEIPLPQGIVVGCKGGKKNTVAMVDTGDVHALMIGAAGVGKTAYWLYPCIEYACASGMSFLTTDTKGDVMRNYGNIAKDYGYKVSVIDLRNPTRSNGNNLLHLVNKYMDLYKEHPEELAYKAKAEKYAKIISKTIILSGMDAASFGQNAYFYDAAEGILTATILLVAEFCEPEKRHIVSVFKVIQELLAPSGKKGKNQFQQLMELLPNDHKAKWFAGSALNTGEQSMASVMSTALSRLNAFLDSELEQLLCFDTEIDAEVFCNEKSAIFVIMPEENPNTFFMISLIISTYKSICSFCILYGYQCVDGKIEFHPQESAVMKETFEAYTEGKSLLELSKWLNERKIEYMPGVVGWNKSRIMRLLEDKRYLGDDGYPTLIDQGTYDAVQEMRYNRCDQKDVDRQSDIFQIDIPVRCSNCNGIMKRKVDIRRTDSIRWRCQNPECRASVAKKDESLFDEITELFNMAIANPEMINIPPEKETEPSAELRRLNNEITRAFDNIQIDRTAVREMMIRYTSMKYAELESAVCRAQRLKDIFTANQPLTAFSMEFLHRTTDEIMLYTDGTIGLILENGQEIRKETDYASDHD